MGCPCVAVESDGAIAAVVGGAAAVVGLDGEDSGVEVRGDGSECFADLYGGGRGGGCEDLGEEETENGLGSGRMHVEVMEKKERKILANKGEMEVERICSSIKEIRGKKK